MKIYLATGVVLVGISAVSAQNITSFQGEQNVQDIRGNEIVVRSFDNRYEGVKGSPFLFEDWASFRIVDKGNAYDLESKVEANVSKIIYKINNRLFEKSITTVDSIVLLLDDYQLPVLYISKYKTGIVISNDERSFLLTVVKQLRKADYKGAYSQNRRYDEYITEVQVEECTDSKCKKLKSTVLEEIGFSKKDLKELMSEGDLQRFKDLVVGLAAL